MELLKTLTDTHGGIFTEGRFTTLNAFIKEERCEVRVGEVQIYIERTKRESVRPSLQATFWRWRATFDAPWQGLWRLRRRSQWGRFLLRWGHATVGVPSLDQRWASFGLAPAYRTHLQHDRALHQALLQVAADRISVGALPSPARGTKIELQWKGEPDNLAVLEQQWETLLRLAECAMLWS